MLEAVIAWVESRSVPFAARLFPHPSPLPKEEGVFYPSPSGRRARDEGVRSDAHKPAEFFRIMLTRNFQAFAATGPAFAGLPPRRQVDSQAEASSNERHKPARGKAWSCQRHKPALSRVAKPSPTLPLSGEGAKIRRPRPRPWRASRSVPVRAQMQAQARARRRVRVVSGA
jgi:hypothetical protein